MQRRSRALGACALFAVLPFLHWVAVAVVALVLLRRGLPEGALALLFAGVPLLGWYLFNPLATQAGISDPSTLMALLGTFCLAGVLRTTLSWEVTLGAAVLVGAAFGIGFQYLAGSMLDEYVKLFMELLKKIKQQMSVEEVRYMVVGYFAMGESYGMVASLVLARWWQSLLYNPGGFQKEFHGLRLPKAVSTGLLGLMLLVYLTGDAAYMRWIPVLTMPMVICAMGLVHWLVKQRELNAGWLVSFYILLIGMSQLVYPLVAAAALLDSWVDIRRKFETDKHDDEV
ncbi:MAG TPA: hypothetical protein VJ998_01495 [Pseudomonadales bacterium]|nr:hypothetical protein [Pseudomonadales bacterium]